MSNRSSQLPGAPPPDPWPTGPPLGFGFGENIPISTLPPVVALTGAESIPVVQNDPNGTPVTMRATATQVAQALPANPNAVPAAFAQNQTIVSGAGPTFPWVPTAMLFASNATPLMDGSAAAGTALQVSRSDHVHPTDTSRYSTTNPANFQTAAQVSASLSNYLPLSGGTVTGGTAFTSGIILAGPPNLSLGGGAAGQILSTDGAGHLSWAGSPGGISDAPADGTLYARENGAWQHLTHLDITDWTATLAPYALTAAVPVASTTAPLMDGVAAVGTGTTWARSDHVHPTDTSRYAASNPSGFQTAAQVTATLAPYALTANVPVASGANPIMDGVAAPGASAAFSRGDHVHPTDTSRYAATNPSGFQTAAQVSTSLSAYLPLAGGTLTGLLTAPSLSAPQAIGDNRIINGDMRIDQRNNGVSGTAISVFTVDRWTFGATQPAKGSWARSTNNPQPSAGFPYGLVFTSSSAYTPLAADQFIFYQPIEADQISDFQFGTANAQPVTLSFWAYSGLTGTFSGALQNYAQTRSYPFSFSVPAATTWTKIVITIPGDTAGTWVMSGNAGAAYLVFDLGAGATRRGPAGAWASASYGGVTGAVSVVATNAAQLILTGVKLEVGSVATPFNRYSLAKCLTDCQRYFVAPFITNPTAGISTYGTGYASAAGQTIQERWMLPVVMRANPTIVANWTNNTNATLGTIIVASDLRTCLANLSATAAGYFQATLFLVSFSAEL